MPALRSSKSRCEAISAAYRAWVLTVLEKHLPHKLLLEHMLTVMPVTAMPRFIPEVTEQQVKDIQAELETIPVE